MFLTDQEGSDGLTIKQRKRRQLPALQPAKNASQIHYYTSDLVNILRLTILISKVSDRKQRATTCYL